MTSRESRIDVSLATKVAAGLSLDKGFLAKARDNPDANSLCRSLVIAATESAVYSFDSSALPLLDEVQDLLNAGAILEPELYWHYLTTRGNICYQMGQQAESLELHQTALEVCQIHSLTLSTPRTLLNIGSLYLHIGDSPGAMRVAIDLLALGAADEASLLFVRELVAEILRYDGVSDLAISHFEVALSTYEGHESRRKRNFANRLAHTYLDAGNTEGARRWLIQLRQWEELKPNRIRPNPLLDSLESRILLAEGDLETAFVLATRSCELFETSGFRALAEPATLTLARIHLERSEYDTVVALGSSSITKAFTARGVRSLLLLVGKAHESMGQFESAANIERDAYRRTETRSLELSPLLELVEAIDNLERLRVRQVEIEKAASEATQLVTEIEHINDLLVTTIGDPLEELRRLFVAAPEANEVSNFHRIANDHLAEIEALLIAGEETAGRTLAELAVPVSLIIERACRDLDQTATTSRVKLERGQPNTRKGVTARWEILELLKSQLGSAIKAAPPETSLRITPSVNVNSEQPFTIAAKPRSH